MFLTKAKRKTFAAALILLLLQEPITKTKKRFWVKDWLLQRDTLSHMRLVRKLRNCAKDDLKNYLRMDDKCFNELLTMVKPLISKKNTKMRKAITAEERLIVTLRYLATGRSLEDLKFSAVISPQALGKIIPETCSCIYKALRKKYLKVNLSNIFLNIIKEI